jgi:hypothetical protein
MGRRRIQQRFAPIKVCYWLAPSWSRPQVWGWWRQRVDRRHDANLLRSYSYTVNHSQHGTSCTFHRSISKRDRRRRPCPVLSVKCTVGQMSCRPNVLSTKCLSATGPVLHVGHTSVGLVSVGQMSVGQMSCRPNDLSAKCLSATGPVLHVGQTSVGQTSAHRSLHDHGFDSRCSLIWKYRS